MNKPTLALVAGLKYSLGEYKGMEVQRDADLKWFMEWADTVCVKHHRAELLIGQFKCPECWRELQKLVEEAKDGQ